MSEKRAKAERKAATGHPTPIDARAGHWVFEGGIWIPQKSAAGPIIIPVPNLFKYAPVDTIARLKHARDVLVEKRVWFSPPQILNDPFDCRVVLNLSSPEKVESMFRRVSERAPGLRARGFDIPPEEEMRANMERMKADPEHRSRVLNATAEAERQGLGVFCMSESWDILPMWAHYADDHKGVCYEFNMAEHHSRVLDNAGTAPSLFPFDFVLRVNYREREAIPEFGSKEWENLWPTIGGGVGGIGGIKLKEWEYEKEWRAIMWPKKYWEGKRHPLPSSMSRYFRGPGSQRLDPPGLLGRVILGYQMDDFTKREVAAMAKEGNVRVFQARPKDFEYGLRMEPYPD